MKFGHPVLLRSVATVVILGCGSNNQSRPPNATTPTTSPSSVDGSETSTTEKANGTDTIVGTDVIIGPDIKLLSAHCDLSAKTSSANDQIVTIDRDKANVVGEICLPIVKAQNLIFIVEASNSMKNRDEDSKTTCHRLESARSLLAKFGGSAAGDAVSVSLIRFENEAAEIAKNKSIDKFLNDDLTFDKFCGGNNGANFQDAFEKAASTLAAISPVVVASTQIYLLTRGDPTKSNSGTDNSGARAGANKIYEINPSIALNTLIVGNISNGDQELMVELAKSESRVMNVEKASEMPTKILTFQNGPHNPSSATANDFTAKISNGSESRALKVLKISKHPTRHSAFRYELEPFTPYSTTGSRVKNVVTVQDRQSKVEAQIEFEF